MAVRLAIILLLLASPASAQMMGGVIGTTTPPAYTGPGDIMTFNDWYSCTRAYSAAYASPGTNKACNYSRYSDGHTCDMLFGKYGRQSVTANCSTSSENGQSYANWTAGTFGVVVTAYDQVGSNNAAQTSPNQPRMDYPVPGRLPPCMTFWGSEWLTATITNSAPSVSLSGVIETVGQHNGEAAISTYNAVGAVIGFDPSAPATRNQIYWFSDSVVAVSATDGVLHAVQAVDTGSSTSVINVDGTETTGSIGTDGSTSVFTIGANGNPGSNPNKLYGYVCEAGYFIGAMTSTQRSQLHTNQSAFYGTP